MKQNITIEDLQSLTYDEKNKLHDYWFSDKNRNNWIDSFRNTKDIDYIALPLLSVGQMIEILATHGDLEMTQWKTWKVHTWKTCGEKNEYELCDALWEGVKDTLGEVSP